MGVARGLAPAQVASGRLDGFGGLSLDQLSIGRDIKLQMDAK